MKSPLRVSLVILCYNEIVGLRAVWDRIPCEAVDEIFAVDGGSTDGSIEFIESKGVTVHRQERRGRGDAFRVAFIEASGDALLFFSPDGNEDPADIEKFRPLLAEGFDMVIGNRMSRGGHNEEDEKFLKWRKWANQGFTLMANLTWNRGKFVADTINGYRALTRSAWDRLHPDGAGYVIEYQCSIRAFKLKLRVAEFPTFEGPRLDERIGSPSLPTGIAFLKLYFRELFTA